ncbi:MAG: exodeoxyribonuclease VII small subunit [Halioglobus sp.]
MPKKITDLDFTKTLQQLESLVESLEHTDISLEKSLIDFEKGIKLTHNAQNLLDKTEQKVNQLLSNSKNSEPIRRPLENGDPEE